MITFNAIWIPVVITGIFVGILVAWMRHPGPGYGAAIGIPIFFAAGTIVCLAVWLVWALLT